MDFNYLLLRCGELFLKGKNRSFFERKLRENIAQITGHKVQKHLQGRFIMDWFPDHPALCRVFGLVSYSPCIRTDLDLQSITAAAIAIVDDAQGSFKVETQRSNKQFPLTSPLISQQIGKEIEKTNKRLHFLLKGADTVLHIEINTDGAYLYLRTIPCFGGLPVGVEGKAVLFVEDDASILAGILMMKRGVQIIPISIGISKDLFLLQKYSPNTFLSLVLPTLSEVEGYAQQNHILAGVNGETVDTKTQKGSSLLFLKPLIAYSSERIQEELQQFQAS